jgi:hypothetical protein
VRGSAMILGANSSRSSFFSGMQTTERYIGCKQRLRVAVNDRLGIEPGEVVNPTTGRTADYSAKWLALYCR